MHKCKVNILIDVRFKSVSRSITLTAMCKDADSNVSVMQILLQKLKHALTHKILSMDNYNFTSFSINFYEWSKIINPTRDLIRISSQPFYSVRKIRRRFTSKLVLRMLAKNVLRAIRLANGKIVSDVRLNAMLLDVWEATANQDIYILISLWCALHYEKIILLGRNLVHHER